MTEEMRKGVTQAIAGRFGLPVYGQGVPQGETALLCGRREQGLSDA